MRTLDVWVVCVAFTLKRTTPLDPLQWHFTGIWGKQTLERINLPMYVTLDLFYEHFDAENKSE